MSHCIPVAGHRIRSVPGDTWIVKTRRKVLQRTLSEKILVYAVGPGLEYYDIKNKDVSLFAGSQSWQNPQRIASLQEGSLGLVLV